jgi:2-haloacid dehalogenase
VHGRLARSWGVAEPSGEAVRFGASIGDWPAFPDTVDALRVLKQHYRLVILSNVDRHSFRQSNARLGVEFDAIHTAQDIGSYKPDPRNFAYLIEHVAVNGVRRGQILHVAQSLFHDHAPANAAGLASAWIDRRAGEGWGATSAPPADVQYDYRFPNLKAFASACREATGNRADRGRADRADARICSAKQRSSGIRVIMLRPAVFAVVVFAVVVFPATAMDSLAPHWTQSSL